MKIFKDGYLLPGYINPNYRGLVGWKCEDIHGNQRDLIVSITKGVVQGVRGATSSIDFYKIPQFTPDDIPDGEWCWFCDYHKHTWSLGVIHLGGKIEGYDLLRKEESRRHYGDVVPYFIAETAERAEELKGWAE